MMKKIGYKLCTVYIVSFILIFVHFQIGIPVNWFVMMSIVNSNKKILMFIVTIIRAWIELKIIHTDLLFRTSNSLSHSDIPIYQENSKQKIEYHFLHLN